MTESQGFWSYVHKDDLADGGRLVQLARDIVEQYEMKTTESIELFLDKDDLEWGADWESRIGRSLASVAFFIPVLTPRYFASAMCRSELNTFARRASDFGVEQILLPILYVDFPGMDLDDPSDDLVALAKRFQWVDWRELRFASRRSPKYRRAVSRLADRLVEANFAVETQQSTSIAIAFAESDEEEAGTADLLAGFEEALPALTDTMTGISAAIDQVGEAMTDATVEVETGGGASSFAKRLQVLRRLAERLETPTKAISDGGEVYTKQLHDIDLGVRTIIETASTEPENRENFCRFFEAVRGLVASAESGLVSTSAMSDSAIPLEKLSRDLRPPLRVMRRGLTLISEGLDVMRPWIALMDASGIDCTPA